MSWVRLDDGFHRNAKQLRMSHAAFRLYVCALSFCAQETSPTGYLSQEQADALRRGVRVTSRCVTELVDLNAWEAADGGYLIHDYDEYVDQGSRERTRQWRERRRHGDSSRARARDGYPVPEPVPVKGSKEPLNARARPHVEKPGDNFERIGDLLPELPRPATAPEFW